MIQSVERAFKILELMNNYERYREGIGGLEISKKLELKHPTVHNFMKSLVSLGYVDQDPKTSKFRLGEKSLCLGLNLLNAGSLVHAALPVMKELSATIKEATVLILYDNGMRNTIAYQESPNPVKITLSLVADDNFYTTATGRVLLANMSDEDLRCFIENHSFPDNQNFKPAGKDEIYRIIDRIRNDGYEMIDKDFLTVIGVPMVSRTTALNASLGTYFVKNEKDTTERISFIVAELTKSSWKISGLLNNKG